MSNRTLISSTLVLFAVSSLTQVAWAHNCATGHDSETSAKQAKHQKDGKDYADYDKKNIVETALAAGKFNTLATALTKADLVDALQGPGPFTVFAPTDEAFAKLPAGTLESLLKPENKSKLQAILKYHVAAGKTKAEKVVKLPGLTSLEGQRFDFTISEGKVKVDNANVIKTDVKASNGVIHVIDAVILPASDNIVTTASNAKKFNTLLAAAKAAGLAEVLSNDGPFTVFAPTDEAFAALGDTVSELLEPANKEKLASILKYHVVSGRVYSDAAVSAGTAKTLEGHPIMIKAKGDHVMINEAKVVKADLDASNGVIHVIDKVLIPGSEKRVQR